MIPGNQFASQRGPASSCCVQTWIARVMGTGVNRAFWGYNSEKPIKAYKSLCFKKLTVWGRKQFLCTYVKP